jgi:hypothetical protein
MDMGFAELKEIVGRIGEDAQVFVSNVSESCRYLGSGYILGLSPAATVALK